MKSKSCPTGTSWEFIESRSLTPKEISEVKSAKVVKNDIGYYLVFILKNEASGACYGFPLDPGFIAKEGTVPELSKIQLKQYKANIYATPYNSNGKLMTTVRF